MKRRGVKLVLVATLAVLLLFAYLKEVGDGGWINPCVALGIMGVLAFIILVGLRNSRREVDDILEETTQTYGVDGNRDGRGSWRVVRTFVVIFALATLGVAVRVAILLDWSQIERF